MVATSLEDRSDGECSCGRREVSGPDWCGGCRWASSDAVQGLEKQRHQAAVCLEEGLAPTWGRIGRGNALYEHQPFDPRGLRPARYVRFERSECGC